MICTRIKRQLWHVYVLIFPPLFDLCPFHGAFYAPFFTPTMRTLQPLATFQAHISEPIPLPTNASTVPVSDHSNLLVEGRR